MVDLLSQLQITLHQYAQPAILEAFDTVPSVKSEFSLSIGRPGTGKHARLISRPS